MKKHIFLIITSCFLLMSATAYTQTDTLVIDKTYEFSFKKPLVIRAGTVVINQADSLYLINSTRFNHYEQLREMLNDSMDFTIDDVILKYEKMMVENEKAYTALMENCNQTALLNQKTISTTETSLKSTLQEIDSTQTSLEKADASLTNVEKELKKSRYKQHIGKLGVGIGGIAIGILIGVLIL